MASPVRDGEKTPPSTRPPPQQTPLAHKTITQSFSLDATPAMDDVYDDIRRETKGHYLVGLKPTRFLEEFLPWNASTPNLYKEKVPSRRRLKYLRQVPLKPGQKEKDMYEPFVCAFDNWVRKRALEAAGVPKPASLRFLRTNLPDTACDGLNPDVSTYWNRDLTDRTYFSRHQTHEEFKPDIGHDAFQHVLDERSCDREEEIVDAAKGEESGDEESDDEGVDDEVSCDGSDDEQFDDEDEVEGDNNKEEEDEDDEDGTVDMDDHLKSAEPQQEEPKQPELPEGEFIAIETEAKGPKPSASSNVETSTELGNHTRGQIAAYAGLVLSMAFRKHFFSILIVGRYARFIRWDRRGAIVTHRFDYTRDPMLMFHFYLRYGQLTPIQRGFDSAVKLCKKGLPEPVRRAFEHYHNSAWYGGTKFKRGDSSLSFDGFYRIKVTDSKDNRTETFFIPPPQYRRASLFPFCRATRRSLACLYQKNVRNLTMCFLKDAWQVESSRTEREADIYRRLEQAQVKHVASMRLGGDVHGLETVTQDWVGELSPESRRLKGRMLCHRIILDTVARDLSTFSWCKVLLSCIADAVEAAQDAYKAGILHRDLSAGNIMIVKDKETKEWRGVLIDWDMCLLWKKPGGTPRHGRTGTWAFISTKLLSNPSSAPHTLWDDLESAFWVLLYEVLHYTSHSHASKGPHALFKKVQAIFGYHALEKDGSVTGGDTKEAVLLSCGRGRSSGGLTKFDKAGINEIINAAGALFDDAYWNSELRLDDPDNKWFPDLLREAARKMDPHSVTPTGLKSPTNDSDPPDDPREWQPASIEDSHTDYFRMQWETDPDRPIKTQRRMESRMVSAQVHGMDGSFPSGFKRSHISELDDDDDDEEPISKRQRR